MEQARGKLQIKLLVHILAWMWNYAFVSKI